MCPTLMLMVMSIGQFLQMLCKYPLIDRIYFLLRLPLSKGATVCFSSDDAKLVHPNGTEFKIEKSGKLYYLNRVVSSSMVKQNSKTKPLRDWHEILGHCNFKDVLALEGVVDGMKAAR